MTWLRVLAQRYTWRRWGRCDACERVRPLLYSPDHGARFCLRHYSENNP